MDRRWHSSILDVQSFRGADCDTGHYAVIAKVRERLPARKQTAHKTDAETFNLKKLSKMEVRKQYQIELSTRFPALANVNDSEYIRLGKTLQRIKKVSDKKTLGLYEWEQHKPWFDEQCSQFSGQRKQAKMRWL
jgi:hypothetical protein